MIKHSKNQIACLLKFAFVVVFLLPFLANAQSANPPQLAEDEQMAQKAKRKLYPGGKDEEPLKVQGQLTQPVRKMAPQTEPQDESGSTDHD
jgi:hypothetical protein